MEYLHHGDALVPRQQRFGGYTRAVMQALEIPVENRYGLRPAVVPNTNRSVPLTIAADLDKRGWLTGVRNFNFHMHLPHYAVTTDDARASAVLARQPIDLSRPHPFTNAGNKEFNALLWMPPGGGRAGDVLVADSTIFSTLFGADESLERFWKNIADGAVTMLELDDIQSGVLRPRPSPYAATYVLFRIDDRHAGRELMRRFGGVVASAAHPTSPAGDTWVSVALTYSGLEALGVPRASLESFAWEFQQGMAARADALGDTGESSPAYWEKPLGSRDVHVIMTAVAPDRARLEAALSRARDVYAHLPGVTAIWRQDCHALSTGREPFGYRDAIGQPAIEGSGLPPTNRRRLRSRPASSCSAISTRPAAGRRCRSPRCSGATAPTSRSASCISASPRFAVTCATTRATVTTRSCSRRR